jgi:hypothetical protein
MNYRLLLSEMLIDYSERMSKTKSFKKRQVYREVLRDLKLALDIEPNQIQIMQDIEKLIN